MIAAIAKLGTSILLATAFLLLFFYFVGILLIGVILLVAFLFIIFLLLSAILAFYYSIIKKPHVEKHGEWKLGRVKGK